MSNIQYQDDPLREKVVEWCYEYHFKAQGWRRRYRLMKRITDGLNRLNKRYGCRFTTEAALALTANADNLELDK